jgi:hypothetical protein
MGEEQHIFMHIVEKKLSENYLNQVLNIWLWVYFETN